MAENVLVDECLHSMMEGYRISWRISILPPFPSYGSCKAHKRARSEPKQRRARSEPKKRPMIVAISMGNGAKAYSSNKTSYGMRRPDNSHFSLPFLYCEPKKATALLEQWVNDRVICLTEEEYVPSLADQNDARYCLYHKRKGHTL